MLDYKNLLNPEQYEVVKCADGSALVLAGAGSGKTRTLVFRVAYLLEKGILPENILLVTFTNKAAREMLDRVAELLQHEPKGLWGGTFHHVGNLFLRQNAFRLGFVPNFSILDQADSESLIKKIMTARNLNTRGLTFPKPSVVRAVLSYAKNTNQTVEEIASTEYGYAPNVGQMIAQIGEEYEKNKKISSAMDFDDLLFYWLKLLIDFPEIKQKYSEQFKYILVDEFQDTNYLQAEIIRHLSEKHGNVLAVGDDSQSIYSFRAADIQNILNFPKSFPNAKIFKIESNYRSTPEILRLANDSIRHNTHQFKKNLKPVRGHQQLPILIGSRDENEEASAVVKKIMAYYRCSENYCDIAVLFRSSFHGAQLQLLLSQYSIPFVVRGGMRYFEQAHIKDVLAYLKIWSNPADQLSWERVLLTYSGIGEKKFDAIWAKIKDLPDLNAVLNFDFQLKGEAGISWQKIVTVLRKINSLEKKIRGFIAEAVEIVIENVYEAYLKNSYENYRDRLDDLEQLTNFVAGYDDLDKLLADVLLSENYAEANEQNKNTVVLSTIHQAKGLEWKFVFVIGLRDGFFPHYKSLDQPKQLEEERRLFYVATTRARDELTLTYPIRSFSFKFGDVFGKPSMFIRELDRSLFVVQGKPPFEENEDGEKVVYVND
ncbi:MAG: UvrD-helicase domain-containing protein [Patescibacteria group bacterium]